MHLRPLPTPNTAMFRDSFESDGCVNMDFTTGFVRYGDSAEDYMRFLSSVVRSYDTFGDHLRIKGSIRTALDGHSLAGADDIVSAWVKQKNNILWICLWDNDVPKAEGGGGRGGARRGGVG